MKFKILTLVLFIVSTAGAMAHPGHNHEGSIRDLFSHNFITVLIPLSIITIIGIAYFFNKKRKRKAS